jgi:hypothetical protein
MEYTVSMNYPIDSWEFGNVLCETIFYVLPWKLRVSFIHVMLTKVFVLMF